MTAGIGSAGMPGLFGLLLAMEAGVPVPVPGDVVMLLEGCCPACLAAGALASARPRTRSESEVAP